MHRYRKESSILVKLATPVLLASVAQTGMGFVDTVMAGGVSATDMAAVAVASSIWLPSILFGIGLLLALVPVVAQLNGSGRQVRIAHEIQQGFYLSFLVAIPIVVVLSQTQHILHVMKIEPVMAAKTNGYMFSMIFAVPAFLLFQTLRSLSDGLSLTKPAMILGFIGLGLNVPLNWIFVYGKFGMPALGAVGCGVATAIVYWVMFLCMLGYVITAKKFKNIHIFTEFHKPNMHSLSRLFRLGFPIAASIFFEVTLFAVVALLIAPLGPIIVAAHQVAINFASMVFMLPMSIAAAVSIRVGHQLGEHNVEGAKVSSHVGLIVAFVTALMTAGLTIVFSEQIIRLYTDNKEVLEIAMHLLFMAAIYQCSDAIQVIAAGALRGYKDMSSILTRTLFSYWIVGMPIGYILGMTSWITDKPMGVNGFWIGIIFGLSMAAVLLSARLYWLHRQSDEVQLEFAGR
ncbi:MATE family efflux transporter [Vibrio rumoiensis]|uniref:Multidrug resistance protein NorM n=1 Tax=Vibrio rumoiensis 1S-45 TaxID=1188252 RepID=A0A1E5E732_9VIBR|nr:MATE family efflux transporter [Vibrio rumoiensis]OEF30160.1 MATE family efflux transporter [Vibrio rumoiensis 1S-45]